MVRDLELAKVKGSMTGKAILIQTVRGVVGGRYSLWCLGRDVWIGSPPY